MRIKAEIIVVFEDFFFIPIERTMQLPQTVIAVFNKLSHITEKLFNWRVATDPNLVSGKTM